MSALDDTRERADRAEAAAAKLVVDVAVEREARRQGWGENAEFAPAAVDRSRISFNPATGEVSGVKDAVTAAGRERPAWSGRQRRGSGGTLPRYPVASPAARLPFGRPQAGSVAEDIRKYLGDY